MRVLIAGGGTGGHLMPALALAEALRKIDPDVEPVLVGATRGVDATILPERPFRYHLMPVEPLYRRQWWKNLRWPLLALRIWRQCGQVLRTERPAFAVGTGGYAAGPILYRAHKMGIPLALQEQNAFPGLTTRLLTRFATQVHLGFPEAQQHLSLGRHTRVFHHGNPIVPPPSTPPNRAEARAVLRIPVDVPVVLVMGGSQGALRVNEVVAECLERGLWNHVALLWSTGKISWSKYAPLNAPPSRQVKPFWDPIHQAYAAADLVIARAGAMSTAELCAWGLPSILIPLPTSAAGHQQRNAEALAQSGSAIHVPESTLTADVLREHVLGLLGAPEKRQAMALAARARGRPNAALEIAHELRSMVS